AGLQCPPPVAATFRDRPAPPARPPAPQVRPARKTAQRTPNNAQLAVFVSSLLGRETTRIAGRLGLDLVGSELPAEPGQQVPQPLVEEVLREAVGDALLAEGAGERLPHRWLAPGVPLYDRL